MLAPCCSRSQRSLTPGTYVPLPRLPLRQISPVPKEDNCVCPSIFGETRAKTPYIRTGVHAYSLPTIGYKQEKALCRTRNVPGRSRAPYQVCSDWAIGLLDVF